MPVNELELKGGWKKAKEHQFFKDFPWQELTNGRL